jgi:hypothetical protein
MWVARLAHLRDLAAIKKKKLAREEKMWIFSAHVPAIERNVSFARELCATSQRWAAQQWYRLRALEDAKNSAAPS